MEIESIHIVTDNICNGPAPDVNDEVRQYLKIHSSGKVSFCARNFGQDIHNKGYCRVKRLNIGPRKAKELIYLADQLTDYDFVTDCGSYTVKINYSSGISREIYGSLPDDKMVIRNDTKTSYSKLLRRYIPVYALWGITVMSPDYEGKKAFYLFAKKWLDRFVSGNLNEFEDKFGDDCSKLGVSMDCGHAFEEEYPGCFAIKNSKIYEKIDIINDIDLLASALYSQWRNLTHWAGPYTLGENDCHWFNAILKRIIVLSHNNSHKIESGNKQETKYTFFWKDNEKNGFFSNWYGRTVIIDDFEYFCAEQYMMAQKAKLFHDSTRYTEILKASTPWECKDLGREVIPFDYKKWDAVKLEVVRTVNKAKFEQNPDLMTALMATGDSIIAEASPNDNIWGIGIDAATAEITPVDKWPGQNLLGKILMELRNEFGGSQ